MAKRSMKKWFNTKKKKVTTVALASLLGIALIGSTALAAEEFNPVSLKSYGVWIFDDGNANNNNGKAYDMMIDTSDLENINRNVNVLKSQLTGVQGEVDVNTNDISTLKNDVESCFQSVSEGKKMLASTLTDLGVETAADATFAVINENIKELATNKYDAGLTDGSKNTYRYGGVVSITTTGGTSKGEVCYGSVEVSQTVKKVGIIDGGFEYNDELDNGWNGTSYNVSASGKTITLGSRGPMSAKVIWFY